MKSYIYDIFIQNLYSSKSIKKERKFNIIVSLYI